MPEKDLPALAVINTFLQIEESLDEILRVVPYCDNHKNVWSDQLATVIIESCILLDSLWRAQVSSLPTVTKQRNNLGMTDYFKNFGQSLEPYWIVFWGEEPIQKYPFKGWSKERTYIKKDENYLDWWSAYNNLKHDRLQNREEATLNHAITAVGALFVAITYCYECSTILAQKGLVSGCYYRPELYIFDDKVKDAYIATESKLFTFAVGWGAEELPQTQRWLGGASPRFVEWFSKNGSKNSANREKNDNQ